jgi:hypothetical protein
VSGCVTSLAPGFEPGASKKTVTDTRVPPAEPGAALPRAGRYFRPGTAAPDPHGVRLTGGREADFFHRDRDRWSHDKAVKPRLLSGV